MFCAAPFAIFGRLSSYVLHFYVIIFIVVVVVLRDTHVGLGVYPARATR